LYEFGFSQDGKPFYAMELVAGETLEKLLARRGALPLEEAIARVIEACAAVEAAHAADVVHRDIKPANLLLSEAGQMKLLDFGVAKPGNELDTRDEGETGALVLVGTPEYMAPEQALGKADVRSDVYALGAVLYELCTGTLPHKADGAVALLEKKQNVAPAPPSLLVKGAKRSFDRAVLKALAADPAERFQNVAEFRAALSQVLSQGKSAVRASGYARTAALSLGAFVLSLGLGLAVTNPGLRGKGLAEGRALAVKAKATGDRVRALFAPKTSAEVVAKVPTQALPVAVVPTPIAVAPAPSPSDAPDPEKLDALELVDEGSSDASDATEALPAKAAEGSADADDSAPSAPVPARDPKAEAAVAEFDALWARGSKLKALKEIRAAARAFPKDPAVLRSYVVATRHTKAWGEALRVAENWVKADPSFEARFELARLERATGHRGRALSMLRNLEKEQPESEALKKELLIFGGDQRLALRP
jgi:hypothetical protein